MIPTRRWTINGRFLSQPQSGVQRYAWEIVSSLDRLLAERLPLAAGLEVELVAPPGCEVPGSLRAIAVRRHGKGLGHAWEQWHLPGAVGGRLLNLCNTGPLAVADQIVCIHDVNTRLCPQSYSPTFRALYRVLSPALGRRCAMVATVSAFSARMIAAYGIAPASKVLIAPNGHEHALRWSPRHSAATRAAAGPDTVVMIGSAAPHKNLALMLEVARRLAPDGLQLAVAGGVDPRVTRSLLGFDAPNVRKLGRVSDAELAALLEDSLCLAFPSLTEGFGLPVLEAMALGKAILSSDRASMPEIGGEAALYAAPDDPEAWREALLGLRRNPALRAELARRGRERAALFSWRRSAEIYLEAMAKLDGFSPADERAPAYA